MVSFLNVKYFEGVVRIFRLVLDVYREGFLLGIVCFDGEVFDVLLLNGIDVVVILVKYYDFIEVMLFVIYCFLVVCDLIKDEVGI